VSLRTASAPPDRNRCGSSLTAPYAGSGRIESLVIYGGDSSQQRSQGRVVAWRDLPQLVENI